MVDSNKKNKIREYIVNNKQLFEEQLLSQAVNVKDKINEIHHLGNINLVVNAHKLVLLVVDGDTEEVKQFAEREGIIWARHSLTLAFKLEWIRAIRRTLWKFITKSDETFNTLETKEDFFILEERINVLIDEFMTGFFMSYSHYKDKLIEQQQKLVDNLSVPIIPVSSSVSILPLIGAIDWNRAHIIEEKVLMEIEALRIQNLIIDFSGIAEMEKDVTYRVMKLLKGIKIMGCMVVITGLRPEVVRNIVDLGIEFGKHTETKGSLQQALENLL